MAERGYYSLIQFVPDAGRAEGANVGIAIVCPADGSFYVLVSENNEAPGRRFGKGSFDDTRLTVAKRAIAERLRHDLAAAPNLDGLLRSGALEGNSLVVSAPRSVAVAESVAVTARELHDELVYLHERRRDRAHLPDSAWLVNYLEQRNVPISKPGQVLIPVTEEPLKVAFAYVNGANHFVHPQGFSKNRHTALEQAKGVGAQGRLLYHHSEGRTRRDKLVVFARFESVDHADTVREIFDGMDVRMVAEDDAKEFADEVFEVAHHAAGAI